MENRYRSHAPLPFRLMDDGFPAEKTDCPLASNIYMLINIHIIVSASAGHGLRQAGGEPAAVVSGV